jgi:hypothetical protein
MQGIYQCRKYFYIWILIIKWCLHRWLIDGQLEVDTIDFLTQRFVPFLYIPISMDKICRDRYGLRLATRQGVDISQK